MRKVLLLASLILLIACGKKSNPTTPSAPSTTTPPTTTPKLDARFVPDWYSNDTLYGLLYDTMGHWTGKYDTIITLTVNDTSMIKYKGVRYYIWWNAMDSLDTFKRYESQYSNLSISTTKDTTGVISQSYLNISRSHIYKDAFGVTNHQQQSLMINDVVKTPFKAWNYTYQSFTTH
jgi:hypothetical protein